MKRILFSCILITFGSLLLVTPAQANVNDFYISDYGIDYRLSRDTEKRSVLEVSETIVAQFPMRDQNRGIERYIPRQYDGHPVGLNIVSVEDETQMRLSYTTYDSGEYRVVRIGDADRYVQGRQTYVIKYTLRDVTKTFSDTRSDEFYWDTNGTEWRTPIAKLDVSLTIDDSLMESLSGQSTCYIGQYGASDQCSITREGNTYSTSSADMTAGSNITLAVGFKPETFAGYERPFIEKLIGIWAAVQVILGLVSVGLLVWLLIKYSSWSRRTKEIGTIIPEYLPPKDSSISLSETLVGAHSSFAAQLIDFAVRHYVKIYEIEEAKLWSSAVYEVEIIKPIDDLQEEEKEFLRDLFKDGIHVGAKVDTNELKKDYKLATRLADNPGKIKKLKREQYGLQEKRPEKSAWFKQFGIIFLVVGLLLLSPPLFILGLVSLIMSATLWVRTDKGLALYRYLEGLKMYISVAEQERLKMLQSPEGAEKVQVDPSDPKKLVKLYERVLPYAILFGQEKAWNKQLGNYYESTGSQPDWYRGANLAAFNATAFSSAMTSLTTSINSTGASYSSSGGSSGGGFSGGGGGGGGGGGW